MKTIPVKTKKFIPGTAKISDIIPYLSSVKEGDIIAISSKIIAICQGDYICADKAKKEDLVGLYAQKVIIPYEKNTANLELTQTDGLLIESAGIDLSNGDGCYILPPRDPYKVAKTIWHKVRKRYGIKKLGVVITDSHAVPMQKGAIGMCICSYGFKPVREYQHKKDVFNNRLNGLANISEALAVTAVLEMGEGNESTPIVIISSARDVVFYNRSINIMRQKKFLYISPKKDVYGPLLNSSLWQKTKKG